MRNNAGPVNNEIHLMELLHQINKEISRRLTPVFRERGLSLVELFVLMQTNRRGSCRATELATLIGVPASTVTGILDRLEKRALLERSQDPNDRRSIQITASSKTKELVGAVRAAMEEALRKPFTSMSESRTRRLIQDLRFILETLEQDHTAG